MEKSESSREQEAAALRKWFSSQKRFGSWKAMERALNITKDYLHLLKNGKRRAIDPELRAKLHDATGLDIFKPIQRNFELMQPHIRAELPHRAKDKEPKPFREAAELPGNLSEEYERARRVKKLLVMLADELEFFKQDSESTRATFRKEVPGEDVGYITTLLRALYNEDQFQRWLLFSKYKMKSDEEK